MVPLSGRGALTDEINGTNRQNLVLLEGPLPVAGAPPPATHAVEQSEVPAHWALLDLVLVCHGRPLATSP